MPGKYRRGYVPGVFDLFHTGHLNLLKNAKGRSEYLVAGVLTDELAAHFKHRLPVIPFEDRMAIVEAVRYVDEVIPVTFENTRKIDAWHQIHFDCHFSGNDHGPDWVKDKEQLGQVGAAMEYFPYTEGISSTDIKQIVSRNGQAGDLVTGKIALYGAGRRGQALHQRIHAEGMGEVVLWMDQAYEAYRGEGLNTVSPDEIRGVGCDKVVIAIRNLGAALEARRLLREKGVALQKIIVYADMG